jgi:hypothetical protein
VKRARQSLVLYTPRPARSEIARMIQNQRSIRGDGPVGSGAVNNSITMSSRKGCRPGLPRPLDRDRRLILRRRSLQHGGGATRAESAAAAPRWSAYGPRSGSPAGSLITSFRTSRARGASVSAGATSRSVGGGVQSGRRARDALSSPRPGTLFGGVWRWRVWSVWHLARHNAWRFPIIGFP